MVLFSPPPRSACCGCHSSFFGGAAPSPGLPPSVAVFSLSSGAVLLSHPSSFEVVLLFSSGWVVVLSRVKALTAASAFFF